MKMILQSDTFAHNTPYRTLINTSMESSLESVASLASMEQHGDDFDEIAFANRMDYEEKERQRKKKRGLRF